MASQPQRISLLSATGLILTAFILDVGSLIPLVNWITAGMATIIFGIWFYLLGISFINPKLLGSALVSFIIETIPFLSWLPSLTAAVIAVIIIVKSEDRLGIKLPGLGLK